MKKKSRLKSYEFNDNINKHRLLNLEYIIIFWRFSDDPKDVKIYHVHELLQIRYIWFN